MTTDNRVTRCVPFSRLPLPEKLVQLLELIHPARTSKILRFRRNLESKDRWLNILRFKGPQHPKNKQDNMWDVLGHPNYQVFFLGI